MEVEVAVLGSLLVCNSPYGLCGRKATLNSNSFCDFVPRKERNIKMPRIAALLNAEIVLVVIVKR